MKQDVSLEQLLIGSHSKIIEVRNLIAQVAPSDASVLLLGESGTGKEVAARAIHQLSARAHKPFVPVNCGAIPSELIESELFGHERGAFTGAITSRQGRFELAQGGTLFLDEIGDMPLPMQVKLLRVLQERTFERVGSNKTMKADVRIIAATHRQLEQYIDEGKFRADLFYRLNVFPIEMPSLADRQQDIPALINHILQKTCSEACYFSLTPEAMAILKTYHWPGNVRELSNLVERLSILYPAKAVDVSDLPSRFKPAHNQKSFIELDDDADERRAIWDMVQAPKVMNEGFDLKEHLTHMEISLIRQALEQCHWVVAHAADFLNMRRTTLVEKMKKYDLTRDETVAG